MKTLFAAAVIAAVSLPATAGKEDSKDARPASRPAVFTRKMMQNIRHAKLTVGQKAPDVDLHRLVFRKKEDGAETGRISTKKVKLSDFKGDRPVVLIFTSYT